MEINEIEMEIDEAPSGSEYEEEEFLVYVDIEPTSLGENQIKQADKIKFFGLETKKPLLQINNLYFEGEKRLFSSYNKLL
jgi:TFIIIC subunit triple barrel domain